MYLLCGWGRRCRCLAPTHAPSIARPGHALEGECAPPVPLRRAHLPSPVRDLPHCATRCVRDASGPSPGPVGPPSHPASFRLPLASRIAGSQGGTCQFRRACSPRRGRKSLRSATLSHVTSSATPTQVGITPHVPLDCPAGWTRFNGRPFAPIDSLAATLPRLPGCPHCWAALVGGIGRHTNGLTLGCQPVRRKYFSAVPKGPCVTRPHDARMMRDPKLRRISTHCGERRPLPSRKIAPSKTPCPGTEELHLCPRACPPRAHA